MKRHGKLWPDLLAWENLLRAARNARRGKRHRDVVLRFDFHLERNLLDLQRELAAGSYRPGPFRNHWIAHPKRRLISAAPYRDRVVHHALMNVLVPILDRHFHPDTYACRAGKGTHAAVRRLQALMRRNSWVLQCDLRKFFPSIDHEILKATFRTLIKDQTLLALMDRIVDAGNEQEPVCEWFPGDDLWTALERRRGLPIGNLTSQWFANWYLNRFDHMMTSHFGAGGYVRYCDDFLILDQSRQRVLELLEAAREALGDLRLRIHPHRCVVTQTRGLLRFVGHRVGPRMIKLPKTNVRKFLRRLRWLKGAFADRRLGTHEIDKRLQSWLGHSKQANTKHLVKRLAKDWIFSRRAPSLREGAKEEKEKGKG